MAAVGTTNDNRGARRAPRAAPVIAYVGLGSNLGDRQANLAAALACLDEMPGIRILRSTSPRTSAAWGDVDQPEFLNAVAEIETTLTPLALLRAVKAIERDLGRQPSRRWGPRSIDIDLLTFGGARIRTADLTLPHPFILDRPFVYEPLGELAPGVLEALRRDATLPV